ncbi:MAG: 2Fe-2S iron-sulfur cluster binding domain-containing protein [Saprospiraceae bacterium]|nr:2Fe-2S iron-sulfur cluster binding domain-containing protein [Saprospiraceae bacterium]
MLHALTIVRIQTLTEHCTAFHLQVPEHLKEIFQYLPGQHLTFEETIDGIRLRRNYSICSGPADPYLTIAVKQVPGGIFTGFIHDQWKPGRTVHTLKPMGRFVLPPAAGDQTRHFIALVGGSGITPVMAMLRHGLVQDPRLHFTIFYSNSTVRDIAFREELDGLKNNYPDRLSLHHVLTGELLDNPLFSGRIDGWKLAQWNRHLVDFTHADGLFLCGPGNLMQLSRDTLLELGVASAKIHQEWFSPPQAVKSGTVQPTASPTDCLHATIEVIRDGQHLQIPVEHSLQTILDAAEAAEIDLPYSCRGGVCATCKTRLLQGEIKMQTNYALEPDELEAGYILACQAIPQTREITISYDGD